MQQQTTEAIERPYSIKTQYKTGLRARMREYALGRARRFTGLTTVDDADPAALAFAEGYRDADDDSDDPRPDDPACLG